jgi:hypothetical protein
MNHSFNLHVFVNYFLLRHLELTTTFDNQKSENSITIAQKKKDNISREKKGRLAKTVRTLQTYQVTPGSLRILALVGSIPCHSIT